jgi:osomolarity two-component system phosphorelay intermediate protein YPD1
MLACENHHDVEKQRAIRSDHRRLREQEDFKQLRDKATFLRGPCNTLGIYKMEGTCARIEQATTESIGPTSCYSIASFIKEARERFREAEEALNQLY